MTALQQKNGVERLPYVSYPRVMNKGYGDKAYYKEF